MATMVKPASNERSTKRWPMHFSLISLNCGLGFVIVALFLSNTVQEAQILDNRSIAVAKACSENPNKPVINEVDLKDIRFVPIQAYNTCGGNILHLSCLRTIIVEEELEHNDDALERLIDNDKSLANTVCEQIISQVGKSNTTELNPIQQASVPLCIQLSDGVVSTLVERRKQDSNDSPIVSPIRFLFQVEAKRILPALNSALTRIVDRKTVIMTQTYAPYSERNNYLREADTNTGNYIWQYGATRLINPYTTQFVKYRSDREKDASAFVFATANALQLGGNGTYHRNRQVFVERTRDMKQLGTIPKILLGIGIQAEFPKVTQNRGVPNVTLFDYHEDYLRTIAQGQAKPAITVRGEITARACRNSGIYNCLPMGCPSLTINTLPNLGAVLQQRWENVLTKLEQKDKTLRIVFHPPAFMIPDKDPKALNMVRIFHDLSLQYNKSTLFMQGLGGREAIENLGFANVVKFNNVEDWFDMLTKDVDLVLSGRIHGAMAGISTATPTVVIPTDYRMQELADIMYIPTLDMENLPQKDNTTSGQVDLRSLLSFVKMDFDAFEKNRRNRLVQYKEVLEQADLEMNPKLLAVTKGSLKGNEMNKVDKL